MWPGHARRGAARSPRAAGATRPSSVWRRRPRDAASWPWSAAYQGYRDFSAEIYLQNFLCIPTVVAMPTDTLPLAAPLRRRPERRRVTRAARPDHCDADGSSVALRRARLVALGVGGFLLPWCVVLGVTLPATAPAQHWPAAWVGLDAGEALAALATAVLLAREDARAALTAAAGGALLLTDAWFDVC